MKKIEVTHIGEDYSTIAVNGKEFECPLGLGLALMAHKDEPSLQQVKVENMSSSRGREVPNQFIITTDDGRFFQSYKSIIAYRPYRSGKTILDEKYWDYSTTTGKYRNEFLGEGIADTRKKIASGEYLLADLNQR